MYLQMLNFSQTTGMEALFDSTRLHILPLQIVMYLQVLIFSQMTKMLDLLHVYLEERGHSVGRIDGATKWQDRQVTLYYLYEIHVLIMRERTLGRLY